MPAGALHFPFTPDIVAFAALSIDITLLEHFTPFTMRLPVLNIRNAHFSGLLAAVFLYISALLALVVLFASLLYSLAVLSALSAMRACKQEHYIHT